MDSLHVDENNAAHTNKLMLIWTPIDLTARAGDEYGLVIILENSEKALSLFVVMYGGAYTILHTREDTRTHTTAETLTNVTLTFLLM